MTSDTAETETLNIQEVVNQVRVVCTVARCLDEDQLVAVLTQISREETLMPIFDPTLYIRTDGAKGLGEFKGIVRALLAFRREIRKVTGE